MTAILSPNNKKRDRLNMTSSSTTTSLSSSQTQQEEYEAALSFLRDFHSKQVSSGDMILHSLHSPSEQLDAIIESTDGGDSTIEDVLSSDFSLALSVGRSSESSLASSSHSSCDVSQPSHSSTPLQQRRGHKERRRVMPSTINLSPTLPTHHQPQTPITSNKRSRMKKCSTSECLLDLISNDNTPTSGEKKESLPSFPTLSKRNEGIYNTSRLRCPPSPTRYEEGRDEYSHYLDLGSGYAGQEQHVAKRHRM